MASSFLGEGFDKLVTISSKRELSVGQLGVESSLFHLGLLKGTTWKLKSARVPAADYLAFSQAVSFLHMVLILPSMPSLLTKF